LVTETSLDLLCTKTYY